jgi:hypothetical protein
MVELFELLKKYNFWGGNSPKTGFIRNNYIENLILYSNNSLIKIITGQRRVGKSYIMRQLIAKLINGGVNCKQIFYLNKELFVFDRLKTASQLDELIKLFESHISGEGKKYIFIDEVQEIEDWEKIVSSLSQDYNDEYELYITGSNSHLLSSELATLLSGRYVQFEIMPFTFNEFCSYLSLEANRSSYIKYIKSGGLPELFHLSNEEMKLHYIASLKDTIILRDIVQRYKIKDAVLLENLFRYIVDNVGNLFSINSLVKYLKSLNVNTNYETLGLYLKYIENTYLVHSVERYDIKGKTLLSGAKKVYLNDLAFQNLMSSFSVGWGQSLENLIYLYCRSKGYKIRVGGINSNEIDFVLEKNKKIIYLQVAQELSSEQVIKREFGNLELIKDNYPKIVVTMDEQNWGNRNGIQHVLAWELDKYL